MIRLVTPELFKTMHGARANGRLVRRAGVPPVGVRKQTTAAVEVEQTDERVLRFTISTGTVDRDRDTIAPAGWQLDNFAKNPVVLWSHQAALLPIGKAIDFAKAPDRLVSSVRFLPAEGYGAAGEFADSVFRLARDGFLSATSVGFRPLKWDFTDDEERGADDWWPGVDFLEQELVEFSIVSVPANPEALIEPMTPIDIAPVTADPRAAAVELEARARRRRRALAAIDCRVHV